MRNKPAVQAALLGNAIVHIRSKRADSRTGLSQVMNLSPSTAGLYVDQLMDDGLVVEGGLDQGAKGRPKRSLQIRSEAGWFAGIEFNADRLQAVAIDFAGQLRKSIVKPFAAGVMRKDVRREIETSIEELTQEAVGPLLSVGVGAAGIVAPEEGVALYYSFIPDWENVPIVNELKQRLGVPVKLENNLRAIALAERWFGAGRSLDDYVILGPRSGFGVAIIKNGHLISGTHHAAGEIGLWDWPFAGHKGHMHNYVSAPAVWQRLQPDGSDKTVPRDLYQAFRDLESRAPASPAWSGIVDDFARILGYLQLLLDTNTYFLHGPLTVLGERFCNAVADRSTTIMPALKSRQPKVIPSSMTDEAGALGAASLAMEAWEPSIEKAAL